MGRLHELEVLNGLWESILEDREHEVFVLLNAPGVGKTVLLNEFGRRLQAAGRGLFIPYQAAKPFAGVTDLNLDLLVTIHSVLVKNAPLIDAYLESVTEEEREGFDFIFQRVQEDLRTNIEGGAPTAFLVVRVLVNLSKVVPVFFLVDEVQTLQEVQFKVAGWAGDPDDRGDRGETGLHYLSRLLKSLLKERVLMILSGTRYRILSQIGSKIGSPLVGKVEPIVLANLSETEIAAYVEAVRDLLLSAPSPVMGPPEAGTAVSVGPLLAHYHAFLLAYSGGHGRTVEQVTRVFTESLPAFIDEHGNPVNYEAFTRELVDKVKRKFRASTIKQAFREELTRLGAEVGFPRVKTWIIEKSHAGLALGRLPEENGSVEEVVYCLVNLGLIYQNGAERYYLTSYFHLLQFYEFLDDEHEMFLHQVLHNRFFQWLCGSHGGFGYTFEIVLATALLMAKTSPAKLGLPFDSRRFRTFERVASPVKWDEFRPQPDLLYALPAQRAVDLAVLQDGTLHLVQVTTGNPPKLKKAGDLRAELEVARDEIHGIQSVRGLFVSLFPVPPRWESPGELLWITGEDLDDLLGADLRAHLVQVKKRL